MEFSRCKHFCCAIAGACCGCCGPDSAMEQQMTDELEYRLCDLLLPEEIVGIGRDRIPAKELNLNRRDRITCAGIEYKCVFRGGYEQAKIVIVHNARSLLGGYENINR